MSVLVLSEHDVRTLLDEIATAYAPSHDTQTRTTFRLVLPIDQGEHLFRVLRPELTDHQPTGDDLYRIKHDEQRKPLNSNAR